MNYTPVIQKWSNIVKQVLPETVSMFKGEKTSDLYSHNIEELMGVTKALGIIGPYRFLQTLLFAANHQTGIKPGNPKELQDTITSSFSKMDNYLQYLTNGGLDRENWFHSELQIINKQIGIKETGLHYKLDSRRLRESLELSIITNEEDLEKGEKVRAMAKEKISEWTTALRNEPESDQSKKKLITLLNALLKTSDYPVNQNTIWVYSALLKCSISNELLDNIIVSNLTTDIESTVLKEIQGEELKFKKVRRTMITAIVLIIESGAEIEQELIEHFGLEENIQQYKLERISAHFPDFIDSTNIYPEIYSACNRLILEIEEKNETSGVQYEIQRLESITKKVLPESTCVLSKEHSSNQILENLRLLKEDVSEAKRGPGITAEQKIDFKALKAIRAHLYSVGKRLTESGTIEDTKLVPTNNFPSTFVLLYSKLIKASTEENNPARRQRLVYSAASLFEWCDQGVRTHSVKNQGLLRKAESMLEAFSNPIESSGELSSKQVFEIEALYLAKQQLESELYELSTIYALNSGTDFSELSEEVRNLIPSSIVMGTELETRSASKVVTEQLAEVSKPEPNSEINMSPLLDDILNKNDSIIRLTSNIKRKSVTEQTYISLRSLLHTLKGTAGLTHCPKTLATFRELESEFEELRLCESTIEDRVSFANKVLNTINTIVTLSISQTNQNAKVTTNQFTKLVTNKATSRQSLAELSISNQDAVVDLQSIDDLSAICKIKKLDIQSILKLTNKASHEITMLRRLLSNQQEDSIHHCLDRIELFSDEISTVIDRVESQNLELLKNTDTLFRKTKSEIELSPIILESRLQAVLNSTKGEGVECSLEINSGKVHLPKHLLKGISPYIEHLIRNSIDHGIGSLNVRRKLNKPKHGTISVNFYVNGPDLTVVVADDGQGIDFNNLFSMMGIELPANDTEKVKAYLEYLDTNGVSTLAKETSTSGKGLGLYSVMQYLKSLNGRLNIITNSEGTKVKLSIPNQALSIKCLNVKQGELIVALPTDYIQSINYDSTVKGSIDLYQLSGFKPIDSAMCSIVLKLKDMAINVDEVLGVEELTPRYSPVQTGSYVGWAKMMDSRTAMIVRPNSLIRQNVTKKKESLVEFPKAISRRVLVVDDSKPMRQTIGNLVTQLGFEHITAFDGIDALNKLKGQSAVQSMVVDIDMPRMNGIHLIENLKRDQKFRDLPIIVVSGKTSLKTRQTVNGLNVNQFITKPFSDIDLMNAIERVMP